MSTVKLIAAVVDSCAVEVERRFGTDHGGMHLHVLTLAMTAAITKYLGEVAMAEHQGLNEPREPKLSAKPTNERAH